jgi:DNA-binding MarR family transcriptional regulator
MARAKEAQHDETGILLGMLSAVEQDNAVTQRRLARDLNIALGLANAYLKRCAKKGFIKIRKVPLNRYAYYLTPRGFAEKSRLTAKYLAVSLDFFRTARRDCTAVLDACHRRGWRRIALYGAGELAEIAVLSAGDAECEIVCVIDGTARARHCAGRPIVADAAAAMALARDPGLEAIVVTDSVTPQQSFDELRAAAPGLGLAAERVVAPDLLRIVRPAR